MAWDPAEPQDTTKLRNAPGVIRANWVAIEDADSTFQPVALNLTNRTVSGPSNDPTAISDAFVLYCKEDASGTPLLYGIDENSVVYQLVNTFTAGANGSITFPGGIIMKWGTATVPPSSSTVAVTFATAFPTNLFSVVVTPSNSSGGNPWTTTSQSVTGFTISAGVSGSARPYQYIAIGN